MAERLGDVSVVVPARRAAAPLARLLAQVAPRVGETVVAVAGSDEATERAARAGLARVVEAEPGRGPQLAVGCGAARGAWLLVLHADSVLGPGWEEAVRAFVRDPRNRRRAGAFRLRYDEDSPGARRTAALANLRARLLGLPYGDQGLLLARAFYGETGGFRPLPLMEDVDLVRRIGRRRMRVLPATIVTSAGRYRRDGWWRRSLRNLLCLGLWFAGVPAARIARLYAGGGRR